MNSLSLFCIKCGWVRPVGWPNRWACVTCDVWSFCQQTELPDIPVEKIQ